MGWVAGGQTSRELRFEGLLLIVPMVYKPAATKAGGAQTTGRYAPAVSRLGRELCLLIVPRLHTREAVTARHRRLDHAPCAIPGPGQLDNTTVRIRLEAAALAARVHRVVTEA